MIPQEIGPPRANVGGLTFSVAAKQASRGHPCSLSSACLRLLRGAQSHVNGHCELRCCEQHDENVNHWTLRRPGLRFGRPERQPLGPDP
jgi:hypothetical protein